MSNESETVKTSLESSLKKKLFFDRTLMFLFKHFMLAKFISFFGMNENPANPLHLIYKLYLKTVNVQYEGENGF